MAVLKFCSIDKDPYNDPKNPLLIKAIITYILRAKEDQNTHVRFYGGRNFIIGSLQDIITQFYTVRNVYHKGETIQGRHFVLSFSSEYENVTPYQAALIAENICDDLSDGYQIIYAVHEDTDNLHVHFFINSTCIYNGKMLNYGKQKLYEIRSVIELQLKIPSLWCGARPMRLFCDY